MTTVLSQGAWIDMIERFSINMDVIIIIRFI